LRRVSTKEKKEVLENYQKEKEIFAVLNIIVKDKKRIDEMVKKLRQKSNFVEFCGNVAVNAPGCMLLLEESGFEKDEANKFVEIIKEKVQEKKATVKTKFTITSDAANGIEKIKKILVELEDKAKINYMGSSNYLLTIEDNNYKEANRKLREALDLLVTKAKESECKIEVAKTK
jgi:translation initiation factor 2 alpha subunit (eIF-2alpha)